MYEIYFETYGCTANYNSTEIMKGLIQQSGLNITSKIEFSDFIVINSCIVKEPTEEKIRRRIFDLLKKFPEKKIILAGCMPHLNQERLKNENIYLLDTSQIKNILNLIQDINNEDYSYEKYLAHRNETKLCLPKISKEKFTGITQISEGCLGSCSYCITRLAKGKLFSYPQDKIIESVKSDLENNCKEIWLTSQDCASYGLEQDKLMLPQLLEKITSIEKNFFLRIGMMNPDNVLKILPELLEIYKNKKIFKFLHIPIQSGSNRILKKMNRNYASEDVLKIVQEFRKSFPEIHISTDVIVGFPSESEEDFQKTFDLIKQIKPETLNLSKFWPRPKTPAVKMGNQISAEIKKQRAIKISRLHNEICLDKQKKFLNKEFNVLVNQKGLLGFPNTYLARDENYKLFAIQSLENKKLLGKKIKVKVRKTTPHYLISEFID
ncbi:tRNA (N(6)-L-threonylcarbamoyladenosine(37)-C(2))-methylthiotransferase [Candidatus Pacearchaeota archaeon]|nr:tRNA (N(6)-L-threonylcarbamoyladenosine(37)-C(2))-methylthiotransferase [Candidatus Pacearchaeota archaeon]